jgi:hypothetical protein
MPLPEFLPEHILGSVAVFFMTFLSGKGLGMGMYRFRNPTCAPTSRFNKPALGY